MFGSTASDTLEFSSHSTSTTLYIETIFDQIIIDPGSKITFAERKHSGYFTSTSARQGSEHFFLLLLFLD